MFPLLFATGHLDVAAIGLLVAVYPAVWGAGQLATGWLSDHWGRKPFVTIGMVTEAAGLAVIASSHGIPGWATGSVLLGAGTAMVYPTLSALATAAAATAPVPITVHTAAAEHLLVPDAAADAVVFCLVLCSIPNRAVALAEARRVLRPHGTLRFFEHSIATTRSLRTVQRLADATIWPLLTGGCHTAADPVADINRADFTAATTAVTITIISSYELGRPRQRRRLRHQRRLRTRRP